MIQSAHALPMRIYDPLRDDTLPSLSWDLYRFWKCCVLPHRQQLNQSPLTIRLDRTVLRYWRELTGGPSIGSITEDLCDQFVAELESVESPMAYDKTTNRLSPNTIRKHCTHLQTILDMTGPRPIRRTKRNKMRQRAYDLWPTVPVLMKPDERESLMLDLSLEDIGRLLAATDTMTDQALIQPDVTPPVFWRSLILLAYNTGARIGTLLSARWPHFAAHDVPNRGITRRNRPSGSTTPR